MSALDLLLSPDTDEAISQLQIDGLEELNNLRARVAELEEAIVNYINDDSTRRDLRHEVEHLLP